jgi:hypothetical protein
VERKQKFALKINVFEPKTSKFFSAHILEQFSLLKYFFQRNEKNLENNREIEMIEKREERTS